MIRNKIATGSAFGAIVLAVTLALSTAPTLAPAGAVPTTNYPPSTTTTAKPDNPFYNTTSGTASTVTVGQNGSYLVTGFTPGATVTITVVTALDTRVLTAVADSNGDVTITVNWLDPHVSVNGSSPIPANYGQVTITVTGPGPSGTVTQNAFFNLVATTTAATTTTSGGGLSFTGSDIAAMTLGALVLIAAGGVLVLSPRRREARRSSH
jgi:hypothetical protein